MAATRASLAGVVRRHCNKQPARPSHFVFQLPPEFAPPLIEDGAIQTRLLPDPLAVLFAVAFARPGHVPDLQILHTNERVVLADRCAGLVQEVFAGVGDLAVNFLNLGFFLFPVVAEFDFAGHAPLVAGQALLVFFEAAQRGNETAITQCGETGNAHVDTNGRGGRRSRLRHFALGLDAGVPFARNTRDGDVFGLAQNVPAVAITHPAQFRQLDAAVGLVDDKLFGVRVTKTLCAAFALEMRKVCTIGKEVFVGQIKVF